MLAFDGGIDMMMTDGFWFIILFERIARFFNVQINQLLRLLCLSLYRYPRILENGDMEGLETKSRTQMCIPMALLGSLASTDLICNFKTSDMTKWAPSPVLLSEQAWP